MPCYVATSFYLMNILKLFPSTSSKETHNIKTPRRRVSHIHRHTPLKKHTHRRDVERSKLNSLR